jgi:phosphoribosylformimino-5-aminoimidazole carboxamide ribotide isomerase
MIIYPAIDMKGGRVVRLTQGDPDRQVIYNDDPVATALRWKEAGAEWLHVVNLDNALDNGGQIPDVLAKLAVLGINIQYGGGLRSLAQAGQALDMGASRIVLGTMIVQRPELAGEAVLRFGVEAVTAALDARDGVVTTHGWQSTSKWKPTDLGRVLAGMGVQYALYTDVSRDGMLEGANLEATALLAIESGLNVISSGGVASVEDIRALAAIEPPLEGAVVGKALYDQRLTLEDAIAASRPTPQGATSYAG